MSLLSKLFSLNNPSNPNYMGSYINKKPKAIKRKIKLAKATKRMNRRKTKTWKK